MKVDISYLTIIILLAQCNYYTALAANPPGPPGPPGPPIPAESASDFSETSTIINSIPANGFKIPIGHYVLPCPTGWVRYGTELCYKLFTTAQTHEEANKQCQSKGGTLASIISQEEQQFLTSYILNSVKSADLKSVWVGGHRVGQIWLWRDNAPFTSVDWYPTYPKAGENCLRMFASASLTQNTEGNLFGKMASEKCTEQLHYMCQLYQLDTRRTFFMF